MALFGGSGEVLGEPVDGKSNGASENQWSQVCAFFESSYEVSRIVDGGRWTL